MYPYTAGIHRQYRGPYYLVDASVYCVTILKKRSNLLWSPYKVVLNIVDENQLVNKY